MPTSAPAILTPISTCTPPSPTRAWHTSPHPYLPLLATASSDKAIRIYSLTSFTLLSTITGGHKRSVRACAWKPGLRSDRESVLATGSFDASAGIWKGDNSRQKVGGGVVGEAAGEGLLGGGGAAGDGDDGDDNEEEDDEDYRFAVVLEGHESEIKSVAWSCRGTFLATCSRDKSVWIWETLDSSGGGAGRLGGDGADDEDNLETVAVLQEHEGDVKSVAWHPSEENCLCSGSYDDVARVWREDADGEWSCVGVCEGHAGTVWCVAWEPPLRPEGGEVGRAADGEGLRTDGASRENGERQEEDARSGPRIITSSADQTVRLWRRKPKPRPKPATGPRIPSVIRSTSDEEEWYEEDRLPPAHDRAIYTVDWSTASGRVVTCSGDGKVVVYEEREVDEAEDVVMMDGDGEVADKAGRSSRWSVVAELEAAHGVYEINHVCWARRCDRRKRFDAEEVIVTTGDDGEVKVWEVP